MPQGAIDPTGPVTRNRVVYRFIDAYGRYYSESISLGATSPASADIEALGDALGAASNAYLYQIDQVQEWKVAADAASAVEQDVVSVADAIVISCQNVALDKQLSVRIPAPIDGSVEDGLPQIGVSTELDTAVTRIIDLLGAGWVATTAVFSQRSQTNNQKVAAT